MRPVLQTRTRTRTRTALLTISAGSLLLAADLSTNSAAAATPITIKAGNALITATLGDSPTARDFIKSLPLTISIKRCA